MATLLYSSKLLSATPPSYIFFFTIQPVIELENFLSVFVTTTLFYFIRQHLFSFADLEALEAELKSVAGIKEYGPTFLTFRGDYQQKSPTSNQQEQNKLKDSQRIKVSLINSIKYI